LIKLGVNIDHIATIREARKTYEPDPVQVVGLVERAGADGITVHLREDRRHIQDRDVTLIRQLVSTKMNLEMALSDEIIEFAYNLVPEQITLVPEKREEVTTEGGLDCIQHISTIQPVIVLMHKKNIEVSLFIEPDLRQVEAAKEVGADRIEFHTGSFANAFYQSRGRHTARLREPWQRERERLFLAAHKAQTLHLNVSAGHGLNYQNISELLSMPALDEVNIGHAIIARSVFQGLPQAVSDMKALLMQNKERDIH